MASSSVNSIQSALDDLKKLLGERPPLSCRLDIMNLMGRMRLLRTFLLCATKLSEDNNRKGGSAGAWRNEKRRSLGSLPVAIEEVVCVNAERIHAFCLGFKSADPTFGLIGRIVYKFLRDIKHLQGDIDNLYINLLAHPRRSNSLTASEVVDIIDSLQESVVDFLSLEDLVKRGLAEALKEKLAFFKSFIDFLAFQGIEHEQLGNLLAHIEGSTIKAAHQIALWLGISFLQLKNVPVDCQVYETYTQALTSSKSSSKSHAPTLGIHGGDPTTIMKHFVDSLLWNLWETLQLDSSLVFFEKGRQQLLYEGLRLLSIILKEKANKFDDKIRDLIRAVICDAGVIIFNISQKDVILDVGLQDLLERIKVIGTEVGARVTGTSPFMVPNTNELGFIDLLLENLMQLTSGKADSNSKNRLQIIVDELVFLRSFLGGIVELRNEQEELQTLWNRVIEVAHKVEFLIDHLVHEDTSDSLATSFDSITEGLKIIKADALHFYGKIQDIKVEKVSRRSSHLPSQTGATITDEVVGFSNEATSIIDRLTRGLKKLQIVAIVGMPGQGKTTLATKVYNDASVMCHFHVRSWCNVSQAFNKKKLLIELLDHVSTKLPSEYFKMTEVDLAEELRRCLKGRTYIMVLDDIWDIETWYSLQESFPNDSNGSRILLTSRLRDVAPPTLLDREPLYLRPFTNAESWQLLQMKLFPRNTCPVELCELGIEIAQQCKGLPLTIVIVAGLLATIGQESWKEVLEGINSGIVTSTEKCINTLELSYRHLPDYLKQCLLYLGAFPEDEEVSVDNLIWLWIAEGFIPKPELRSLEDVAEDYVMDLIGRSLVLVARRSSLGNIKTCRVHDLLRDFCLRKAKEENFFQLLKGYDDLLAFHEPCYLRRLCIHSEPEHFKDSRLFSPRARSLFFFAQPAKGNRTLFDITFVFNVFKILKVLDIRQINLGSVFPSEVELLVQLRYLAVNGDNVAIPSTISNLSNLETFILCSWEASFPDDFWNLKKLRHLHVSKFILPVENLDECSNLFELDYFSGAIISWRNVEKQMRKFPNIRKLNCSIHWDYGCKQIFVPDFLTRLESLHLSRVNTTLWNLDVLGCFPLNLPSGVDTTLWNCDVLGCFPMNLKKLTLLEFGLGWNQISTIAKLPNLEVLKLLFNAFSGETWDMEQGGFSKLRILKLVELDFHWWKSSDDQFPNLQKLVLNCCLNLQELPCLENITTLEMIEVWDCPECINSSVKRIQEVQMDMGNSDLKIIVRSRNE